MYIQKYFTKYMYNSNSVRYSFYQQFSKVFINIYFIDKKDIFMKVFLNKHLPKNIFNKVF